MGLGNLKRPPRKPRTLRQHLIRRLLVVIPASLLMVVLMKSGWIDFAADRMTFDKLSWFDNTKLVEHLRILVRHDGLTDEPAHCLMFIVNGDDPPNATRIDVMAKHVGNCPNPNGEFPKLFTVKVDKAERLLFTDAGTPGNFRPMPQ
ncbi:hypothetical protein A0U93_01365 [Neoasaia chiangmaiensis]|uniref:Uncharacterized protein n=1 Tax=Neoasaia chiangmaiensis TaxID=320497 RepID=A0A1U9KLZ9_9PROT|nr:hypothetical protein [Neoasaia chiangmaiensis]AQS86821.1 hypothetical protein A0U93_01365 [Neoasaia chiangmaiensis]